MKSFFRFLILDTLPHKHLSKAKAYNDAWEAFFKDNPNPSISDIEKHMWFLMETIYDYHVIR